MVEKGIEMKEKEYFAMLDKKKWDCRAPIDRHEGAWIGALNIYYNFLSTSDTQMLKYNFLCHIFICIKPQKVRDACQSLSDI